MAVVDAANRLHVLTHSGSTNELFDHWWDGASWYWIDWGKPNYYY